jgi:DNA polymerase III psi subunit
MTLLDRFRTQARDTHADPAVRLAFVQELPIDQRETLAAFARDDPDARVRRAAVAKLMDPTPLSAIARTDADDGVRGQATAMLRDIALEAFEGIGETESTAAVELLTDGRTLAGIAKSAPREAVARLALQRISDPHMLGSIARHAAHDAVRRDALAALRDRGELLSVALNGEFADTAAAAVDSFSDRADLEQIEARAKNKHAVKRARVLLREMDERAAEEARDAKEAAMAAASAVPEPPAVDPVDAERAARQEADRRAAFWREQQAREAADAEAAQAAVRRRDAAAARTALCERLEQLTDEAALDAVEVARAEWEGMPGLDDQAQEAELAHRFEQAARACERRVAERKEAERRRARLTELADDAVRAAAIDDLPAARRQLAIVRREWTDLSGGVTIEPDAASRYAQAEAALTARDAVAREQDQRARREALGRVQQLIERVESLVLKADLSLKASERALRDIRGALAAMPPLPSKKDYDEAMRRLKAAHTALTPKVQELREVADWQRWANVGIQEQLCEKMAALAAVEDPEEVGRQIRDLQNQWRQAADVPRAQGDALWKRFKAAHDIAWKRCEAHFAAQDQTRAENLAKKVALCERAEALADSTSWIQTADEIKRLQADWKTIGPVSRGQEKAIWERFRTACDRFFTRRQTDLAQRKAVWAENLAKKEALCVRAEALAESSEWEQVTGEIKRLQAEWKSIGPVKKSRSEAIWQRFRGACDRFFTRYAQRHDVARAERVAAREAIVAELEALAPHQEGPGAPGDGAGDGTPLREVQEVQALTDPPPADPGPPATAPPEDLMGKVRALRARWQQELAARGVDREQAMVLDRRFAAAFARVIARWPVAFGGTDLDPDANRKKMESLVRRIEELAGTLAGRGGSGDETLSPTTRLAAMLKEALASNTIGGKVDDDSRWRAAAEDVRQAQASWARLGPVSDEVRRALSGRFERACRTITERAAAAARPGGPAGPGGGAGAPAPGGRGPDGRASRPGGAGRSGRPGG